MDVPKCEEASSLAYLSMSTPLHQKSSVDEIRKRFDLDVERFSNLETGQAATIDAPLAMELITQAAMASTPSFARVLDIGCGAGNNSLRLRQLANRDFDIDLLDVSPSMLERAHQRLREANRGDIRMLCGDFREIPLASNSYDIVIAAAVLHHLRDDSDWKTAFKKVFRVLKPGGSFWITDLVSHESDSIQQLMWQRYGAYLSSLNGESYRDRVFEYIDKEDSPKPVTFQLDLLRESGFSRVEILHKNSCFAAFGAIKS